MTQMTRIKGVKYWIVGSKQGRIDFKQTLIESCQGRIESC